MSWLLGAKALLRYPFCPVPRRASFCLISINQHVNAASHIMPGG
nr:MAG TPA: hypothetical protein [Caudoviricetes sp.]